jgi:pseudouridylate synthase
MSNLDISPEVSDALSENRPVVALESTLITHGLPWPENVETALSMEAAVREGGAVPATIAILGGAIRVGLTRAEIEHLGQLDNVRKCSRRDLGIAVGLKENAATTVAGTMIVAHMAGIRVFSTGGIGGVHRGHPFDVSADLIELGRTPVAVVCSGAKSILDLPLTLEVLETHGVPILGFGTDVLPSFYSRATTLPIDARIDTPELAALVIAAAGKLGQTHGILIAVPVPQDSEIDQATVEAAIVQATAEADVQGISGKRITPFVLGRVAELTGGASRAANKALLRNNAFVGGRIASALSALAAGG